MFSFFHTFNKINLATAAIRILATLRAMVALAILFAAFIASRLSIKRRAWVVVKISNIIRVVANCVNPIALFASMNTI